MCFRKQNLSKFSLPEGKIRSPESRQLSRWRKHWNQLYCFVFLFRSILHKTETNTEQDEIKSTIKPADHFLLHVQDEPRISSSSSSWTNTKNDQIDENKKTLKIPTPPPSSFVPININPTIQPPPISSSPAYSDISDEDPTTTNENEQIPPSTINLLNEQSLIPNTSWTTEMLLLQQYGSYMQHVNKELTSNR